MYRPHAKAVLSHPTSLTSFVLQWTSFDQPDHTGLQLSSLQALLANIASGKYNYLAKSYNSTVVGVSRSANSTSNLKKHVGLAYVWIGDIGGTQTQSTHTAACVSPGEHTCLNKIVPRPSSQGAKRYSNQPCSSTRASGWIGLDQIMGRARLGWGSMGWGVGWCGWESACKVGWTMRLATCAGFLLGRLPWDSAALNRDRSSEERRVSQ